jgi:hypothetical protein
MQEEFNDVPPGCPTPDEIRRLAEAIRQRWTPRHEALAAGQQYPPPKYRIPECRVAMREPRLA